MRVRCAPVIRGVRVEGEGAAAPGPDHTTEIPEGAP